MKTIKDYIGKTFIYIENPNTVYTVQECVEDLVKISWDGRYVYYGLSEVMRLFAEGSWEFIETPKLKINIPQDETDHLLSTLANKKRLMEDVANNEPTLTSEEFFRKKLKEINPSQSVITLSREMITAEQGMMWAKEYSDYINKK